MIKTYLITDPKYYKDKNSFSDYLSKIYRNYSIDYVCFRDKTTKNLCPLLEKFKKLSKDYHISKTFINQHITLAKEFNLFGVHLTSKQFKEIEYAKSLNLFVIISTHTFKEALEAKRLGADAITYSPIFSTPNKGKPKGIEDLIQLIEKVDLKIFALGGIISNHEIELLKEANPYGFASIRYFLN